MKQDVSRTKEFRKYYLSEFVLFVLIYYLFALKNAQCSEKLPTLVFTFLFHLYRSWFNLLLFHSCCKWVLLTQSVDIPNLYAQMRIL